MSKSSLLPLTGAEMGDVVPDAAVSRRFVARMSWIIVAIVTAAAATMSTAVMSRGTDRATRARIIESASVVEFAAMIVVVALMRRRLSAEVDRVAAQQATLVEQNESLGQLNRHLELAQQVAKLAYWEIERDGTVYWSDEMYRLCGLEPRPGAPPTDRYLAVIHPDDRDRMTQVARRAVEERRSFSEQYRIVAPGRPPKIVQASGDVLVEQGGHKLVGTVQDITDRAALEAQLRQSQKMDAIGKLAGGVAHDFNNILTVIDASSHFIIEDPTTSDSVRSDAREVQAAAQRAAALTRQLLAFSRQQVFQARTINLNESIAALERMLRRLLGAHIDIQTRLEPDLWKTRTDPAQIDQVLMNLAVNARDAMPEGGALTIETGNVTLGDDYTGRHAEQRPGRHVVLAVSDSGVGIPPEIIDEIFEPFFTTKPREKGTGLGLSTVHGIVEQSGGHIRVYSEPGYGTTFKVYLPVAEGEDPPQRAARAQPRQPGNERILLVEDDASVRMATTRLLQRAGYHVYEARNAGEALAVAQVATVPIDLMITDMVMPGMSGADLAKRTRELRPGIPILMMSGYTRDAMLHRSTLEPDMAFLDKPFTMDGLNDRIRSLLDRA